MSTVVLYILCTACQYLTLYSLLVLCHYVHCFLLQSVHGLSVPHTGPSLGSVPLCPLLRFTVSPMSVSTSHCNVCWFCVTMSNVSFYSLSTACHYLTLDRLLVLCHYVHCFVLQSLQSLSVPHIVPSVCSVSLCPLFRFTVCPWPFNTSHCTVSWFCVTMSTASFYSLSNVCQYLTLYRLLVLCPCVHCFLLQSVQCLSVPHILPSVGSVSLCPLLPFTVCQYLRFYRLLVLCPCVHCFLLQSVHCLSLPHILPSVCSVSLCPLFPFTVCPRPVSTSHWTVSWFCATMSTASFYSLSNVCQYLTLYRLLVLCHYVQCFLLQSVHCLSVPHILPSVGSVSLCPLFPFTVWPRPLSTSHCTVSWFCVTMSTASFYSLSNVFQYLTFYRLFVLCHYVHCFLLLSVHGLSVPHTVPSVGSVSLCPLLRFAVSPMCVNTSHCTVCLFCVTMSTASFYSLPIVCQYLTFYRLLVLCHYVHCFLLQSVHFLSVPHILPSVGSVSLCPLFPFTVCPLSFSTSHFTVCWFCVTMSTVSFYCLSTACQYLTVHRLLILCHYVLFWLLQSAHCLSVPHTLCAGFHQNSDYNAALTPSAASRWQLWQTRL